MQPDTAGGGIGLAFEIRSACGIAREIPQLINHIQATAVHRATKEVTAIDVVSHVLQHRQFGFHHGGVVAVVLMAHQTAVQLTVGHVIIIQTAILKEDSHRNSRHSTGQYLFDVTAGKIALVFAHVKA
ncbi:hypothetical protein D3C80_1132470 [compost metagenome]